MIRQLAVAFLSIFASGCVSSLEAPTTNVTQVVGDYFVGHPIKDMATRYGAPLRQVQMEGETIYSWDASDTLYFDSQPPALVRCQLDAYVPANGIVRTLGVRGNYGACVKFIP